LTIDDPRVDPNNPSCFSNQSGITWISISFIIIFFHKVNVIAWQYDGTSASLKSSLTIFAGSLLSNRTYQLMVYIQNRQNSLLQATGYLLVQVVDTQSQMIVIG
jgi:hypothetical protein